MFRKIALALATVAALTSFAHAGCNVGVAEYKAVKSGMTAAQVEAAVGCKGDEALETEAGSTTITGVNFMNADYSMLTVVYINGKVCSKLKINLK